MGGSPKWTGDGESLPEGPRSRPRRRRVRRIQGWVALSAAEFFWAMCPSTAHDERWRHGNGRFPVPSRTSSFSTTMISDARSETLPRASPMREHASAPEITQTEERKSRFMGSVLAGGWSAVAGSI